MPQPARQADGAPIGAQTFRNRIPTWITRSELYSVQGRSNRTSRTVLETIADHCDCPDAHGNLLGAYGTKKLAARAGVAVSTFWQHVKRLEGMGMLVCVARGGVQGEGLEGLKRILSNTWGIPGAPGSLDHLRAHRREQTMRPTGEHDARGRPKLAPEIICPGAQAMLWRRTRQPTSAEAGFSPPGAIGLGRPPPQIRTTPVRQPDDPRPAAGHYQNHDHTRELRNHGVAASAPPGNGGDPARTVGSGQASQRPRKGSGASIQHIEDAGVLTDTPRLLALLRRERARGGTKATPVQWIAAAERAVRVTQREGGDPRALFADLVNRQRWLFLSEQDLAQARQRIEASAISQDARIALTAIQLAKHTGQNAFHLARNVRPGLTLQRWEQLLAATATRSLGHD